MRALPPRLASLAGGCVKCAVPRTSRLYMVFGYVLAARVSFHRQKFSMIRFFEQGRDASCDGRCVMRDEVEELISHQTASDEGCRSIKSTDHPRIPSLQPYSWPATGLTRVSRNPMRDGRNRDTRLTRAVAGRTRHTRHTASITPRTLPLDS